jgi:hypothetical protein
VNTPPVLSPIPPKKKYSEEEAYLLLGSSSRLSERRLYFSANSWVNLRWDHFIGGSMAVCFVVAATNSSSVFSTFFANDCKKNKQKEGCQQLA